MTPAIGNGVLRRNRKQVLFQHVSPTKGRRASGALITSKSRRMNLVWAGVCILDKGFVGKILQVYNDHPPCYIYV